MATRAKSDPQPLASGTRIKYIDWARPHGQEVTGRVVGYQVHYSYLIEHENGERSWVKENYLVEPS